MVPSLQRRLRKFRTPRSGMSFFNVFKDCSDRYIYHSSWIDRTYRGTLPLTTRVIRAAVYFSFFLYLALPMSNSTLLIPDYVHGKRVICSNTRTDLGLHSISQGQQHHNHSHPELVYPQNFGSFMIPTVKLFLFHTHLGFLQSSKRLVQP